MAYCLNAAQNIDNGEIQYMNPTIGYITFYEDRIIVDNKELYTFYQEKGGVRTFKGKTLSMQGLSVIPILFVDPDYENVVLFVTNNDEIVKAPVHLMEIDKFQTILRQNSGISNNIFISNADNYHCNDEINTDNSIGTRNYYNNRYGYKECYSCHGYKKCSTCNGKGWIRHTMTNTTGDCPNCIDGRCSSCEGTGKVYGVK